jgi:PAS domain S-box-containing protein
MTVPFDLRGFGRELDELTSRVASLRQSKLTFGDDGGGALDAALLELENAEEELRACRDELENSSRQLVHRAGRQDRERQLLRQVFRHAPFGLFVLDHAGIIRQANPRAAGMTGTPLEFLAGKPMPVFVDMPTRSTFRSHLAAVLRDGRTSVIGCQLTGRGHPADVQLVLSRLTGPESENPLALAAAWTGVIAAELISATPRSAHVAAMVEGSLRLDVMGQMTRLLLSRPDDPRLLTEAAQLLTADCADWAIIDLVKDGKPEREAVAGVRGPLMTAPPDSPVIKDVLATGGPVVLDPIEDDEALGHATSGAPIVPAIRAGSLVSAGLPAGEEVAGALTLIRRDNRRGFSLADAALFTEIATHLAITMTNRGMLDGNKRQTPGPGIPSRAG